MDRDLFDNPNLRDINVTPGFEQEEHDIPEIDVELEDSMREVGWWAQKGHALYDGYLTGKDYALSFSLFQKLKHWGLGQYDLYDEFNAGELKEKFGLEVDEGTTMNTLQAIYAKENKETREANARRVGRHYGITQPLNMLAAFGGMLVGNMLDPMAWLSGHAVGAVARGGHALYSRARISEALWKASVTNRAIIKTGIGADRAIRMSERLRKIARQRKLPYYVKYPTVTSLAEGGIGNLLEEIGVQKVQSTIGHNYELTALEYGTNIFMPALFYGVGVAGKGAGRLVKQTSTRLGIDFSKYLKPSIMTAKGLKARGVDVYKAKDNIYKDGESTVGAMSTKRGKAILKYNLDSPKFYGYDEVTGKYETHNNKGEAIDITYTVNRVIPKMLKEMGIKKYEDTTADVKMSAEDSIRADYESRGIDKVDEYELNDLIGVSDKARELVAKSKDGLVSIDEAIAARTESTGTERAGNGALHDTNPALSVEWREATNAAMEGLRKSVGKFRYGSGAKIQTYAAKNIAKEVKAYKYLSGSIGYTPGGKRTIYEREKDLARVEKDFVNDVIYGDSELEVRFDTAHKMEYDFMAAANGFHREAKAIIEAMSIEDYMIYSSLAGNRAEAGLAIFNKIKKGLKEGGTQRAAVKEAMELQRQLKKDVAEYLKRKREAIDAGKPLSDVELLKGNPNGKYIKDGVKEVLAKMGNFIPKKLDTPLKSRLIDISELKAGYKVDSEGNLTNTKEIARDILFEYQKKMTKIKSDFKKDHEKIIDLLVSGPESEIKTIPMSGVGRVIRHDGRVYEHTGLFTLKQDLDHRKMLAQRRIDALKGELRRAEQMRSRFSGEGLVHDSADPLQFQGKKHLTKYMEESTLRDDSAAPGRIAEHIEELKAQIEDAQIDLDRTGISSVQKILKDRYMAAKGDFDKFMASLTTNHKQIIMDSLVEGYDVRPELLNVFLGSDMALNRIPPRFMDKLKTIKQEDLDKLFARKMTINQLVKKYDQPYRNILNSVRNAQKKIKAAKDKTKIQEIRDDVLKKYKNVDKAVLEDIKRVFSGRIDEFTFGFKYLLAPDQNVRYYKQRTVGTIVTDTIIYGRGLTDGLTSPGDPNVYMVKDHKGNLRPTLINVVTKKVKARDIEPSYRREKISAKGMISSLIKANDLKRAGETIGEDLALKDFYADKQAIAAHNAKESNMTWDSNMVLKQVERTTIPTKRSFEAMFKQEFEGDTPVDKQFVLTQTGFTREQVFKYLEDRGRIHVGDGSDYEVMGGRQQFTEGGPSRDIGDPRDNKAIDGNIRAQGLFDEQAYLKSLAEDMDANQLKAIDAVASGAAPIKVEAFPNVSKKLLERISKVEDPRLQAVLLSKHRLDGSGEGRVKPLKTESQKKKGHYAMAVEKGWAAKRPRKRKAIEVAMDLSPAGKATPAEIRRAQRDLRAADKALKKVIRDEGNQEILDKLQRIKDDIKRAEGLKQQDGREAILKELIRRQAAAEAFIAKKGITQPKPSKQATTARLRKANTETLEFRIKTYIRGVKNRMFDRDAVLANFRDEIISRNKKIGQGMVGFIDEYSYVLNKFIESDPRFADLKPELDELRTTKVLANKYGDAKVHESLQKSKEFLVEHEAGELNLAEIFPFLRDPVALTKHTEAIALKKGKPSSKVELEELFDLDNPIPVFKAINDAAVKRLKNNRRRQTDIGTPEKPMTAMEELEIDSPDTFRKIKTTEDNMRRCLNGEPMKPDELGQKSHLAREDAPERVRLGEGLDDGSGNKIGRGAAESKAKYSLSQDEINAQLKIITKHKVGTKDSKAKLPPAPKFVNGRIEYDNKAYPDVDSFIADLYGPHGVGKVIDTDAELEVFKRAQLKIERALLERPVGWLPQKAIGGATKPQVERVMSELAKDPTKTIEEISMAAHGSASKKNILKTKRFLKKHFEKDTGSGFKSENVEGLRDEMRRDRAEYRMAVMKNDGAFRKRRANTDERVKRLKDRRNK